MYNHSGERLGLVFFCMDDKKEKEEKYFGLFSALKVS